MRLLKTASAIFASLLAATGAVEAATPAQAGRAAFCMVDPDVIERSVALQSQLEKFEQSARFVQRGDGDVEIIEFFDYSCPACRAWRPVLKRLAEENPNVRVEIVDYPIYAKTMVSRLTGNKTLNASLIGLAALDQSNKTALAFHDALMGLRGRVTEPRIKKAALAAGVDLEAAQVRADAADIKAAPAANIAYADTLGIAGTPGLVVDGIILRIGLQTRDEVACLVKEASRAAAERN